MFLGYRLETERAAAYVVKDSFFLRLSEPSASWVLTHGETHLSINRFRVGGVVASIREEDG